MFQPAKVNPVFAKGTFGVAEEPLFGANCVTAADDWAVVLSGTTPLVFEFPL